MCAARHARSQTLSEGLGLVLVAVASGCSLEAASNGDGRRVAQAMSNSGDGAVVEPQADADVPPSKIRSGADMPLDATVAADAAGRDARLLDAANASDAGSEAGLDDRDGSGALANASCSFEGAYALRADFAVTWFGTAIGGVIPVIAPGQGTLTIYAASTLGGTDRKNGSIEIKPCGATVPDFAASNSAFISEVYGAEIPNAAWEQKTMPRFTTESEFGCFEPGCSFSSLSIAPLLGAPINTPEEAFWSDEQVNPQAPFDARDDDDDGALGVTLYMRGPDQRSSWGTPYAYPPLGLGTSVRARSIMLSMGTRARMAGVIESCRAISGALHDGEVRTRAVGCSAYRSGADAAVEASPVFVRFLDDNLPKWQVGSGSFRAVRIADTTCESVRAAFATAVSPTAP